MEIVSKEEENILKKKENEFLPKTAMGQIVSFSWTRWAFLFFFFLSINWQNLNLKWSNYFSIQIQIEKEIKHQNWISKNAIDGLGVTCDFENRFHIKKKEMTRMTLINEQGWRRIWIRVRKRKICLRTKCTERRVDFKKVIKERIRLKMTKKESS